VHVDAVQQRTGDAVQVAADFIGRTAALLGAAAEVTAGTGIHRTYQDKTAGIGALGVDPCDGHEAVLHGLAQGLQHVPAIFGQLVQEQHAGYMRF